MRYSLYLLFISAILLVSCSSSSESSSGINLEDRNDSLSYAYGISMLSEVKRNLGEDVNLNLCVEGISDRSSENENFDEATANNIVRTYMIRKTMATFEPSEATKFEDMVNLQDSASYGVGVILGSQLEYGILEGVDPEVVKGALADLNGNAPKINQSSADSLMNIYARVIRREIGERNIVEGRKFLAENATKEGVIQTASGLQYEVIQQGEGPLTSPENRVTFHYKGEFINGRVFDKSEEGQPITFPVTQLIPGWIEALQLMNVGSKYKLYVPSDIGYGPAGRGPAIMPNETLIFDLELVEIN